MKHFKKGVETCHHIKDIIAKEDDEWMNNN